MKKTIKTTLMYTRGCFFEKECKLFIALIFFLTASTTSIMAQDLNISGNVSDFANGEMIPGATVVVKGSTRGAVTSIDGKYSIDVNSGETIVYSTIGYTPQEIVAEKTTVINISLKPSVESLEEMIVVGYGTSKKSDVTGAITSISESDIKAEVVNSLDQAIQGKAAGVQVTQNSGSPSAATSIRIRGANSLLRNNEPLYVIDGVPVNSDAKGTTSGFDWAGGGNGQTAVNVLSTINPADIVSIEVLKDASSTAIYGSRGANGVILVTTKKGKNETAVVSYNFNYGIQTPAKYLDPMNLREFAEYQNELADKGYIDERPEFGDISLVPEEGTNWQKELFRQAIMTEHHLSISGGSEKTQYSISGGYKDQEGMVIGSDFNRITGRVNVSSQAKEWLNVGVNLSASRSNETLNLTDADDGVITGALLMSPYLEVRTIDGEWSGPNENNPSGVVNPIAKATEISNKLKRTRLLGNTYADIQLFPFLKFRSEFGTDISFTNNYGYLPMYDWGASSNSDAKSRRQFANNSYWIQKNYLTYDQKIEDHQLKVMLGQENQKSRWESLTGQRNSFVSNDVQELQAGGTENMFSNSIAGSNTQTSAFGRVNYNYKGKYLFTGTYRADGSSKFGPNNKWGYFPSMALAWRIMEEDYMKQYYWLTNLKLRSGWGQVGNDAIGNYSYGSAMKSIATPYNTGYYFGNFANSDIKWETTTQWNFGLDLGFFDNRLGIVAEYYQKYTEDMLLVLPVPDYLGTLTGIGQGWQGIQAPYSNLGEMENKGFEITVNTVNIARTNFTWNTNITFSRNKNKVTSLGLDNAALYEKVQWYDFVTKTVEGQSIGQFYGFKVDGIFQSEEEVRNSPTQASVDEFNGTWAGDIKYKDLNNDGVIDDQDRTFIGDPNPDFTFGISNSFTYKSFDLSIFMNGSYGNDIYNFQRIKTEAMSNIYNNQLSSVTERWTEANKSTSMPRFVQSDPNQNTRISDRYIEDGSYLRISNITFGYSLPDYWLSKTPLTSLRVFSKIQNAYTFTKYSGYDPEVGAFNQNVLLTGVDNGRFPMPRTFLFGMNITF